MMFNIPIPEELQVCSWRSADCPLFGPWIATISVTVALIVQAFVFGDGGITALGPIVSIWLLQCHWLHMVV